MAKMAESQKAAKFRKCYDGKFECLLCNNRLSSKQRVLIHLYNIHHQSPFRRQKKLYLDDDAAPVPKRTLYRWKARSARSLDKQLNAQGSSSGDIPQKTADTLSDPQAEEPSLPGIFKAEETYDFWEESSQASQTSSKNQLLCDELSYSSEKDCLPECLYTVHSVFSESNSMSLDEHDEHLYSGDDNYVSDDQCVSEEPSESDNNSFIYRSKCSRLLLCMQASQQIRPCCF